MRKPLKIEAGKQYKTRGRRLARIYATDGFLNRIHGAILWKHGWCQAQWESNGRAFRDWKDSDDITSAATPQRKPQKRRAG